MSAPPFSWPRLIAEIPTDVVFQVVENGGELHEVNAHKMILGMVSPIFNTMFYNTEVGDKTVHEIKIEETTEPAFQIMIDAIYNYKAIEDSLKDKSVRETFDVVNLIERYQIAEFKEIIEKLLSSYPVTEDGVLEVAAKAVEFSNLFQKEAQMILLVCANFLLPKLKDAKSIFKYVKENEDEKEVVATLLTLMDEIAECTNCWYEDCQDGEELFEHELRVGLIVSIRNDDAFDFTATITKILPAESEGGETIFEADVNGSSASIGGTLGGDTFFYCKCFVDFLWRKKD